MAFLMTFGRSTLYLSRAAVEQINLSMDRIIEVVEASLVEKASGRVQMPAKHWMEPRQTRWFGGMSSLIPSLGYAAMKWQSGSTENAKADLPYLTGMLFLNRLDDGLVSAVMDSTWLTQQRTAAESAVAVKYLAKAGVTNFAMLGCGVQARSHLQAFRLVMPHLSEVVAFDINPAAAAAFAREVEAVGLRARIVQSARAAIDATDIVITAGQIEPHLPRTIDADWLHPGLLGITLDYDCYWKAAAFNAADKLFTDDFDQVEHIKEYGYFVGCPQPLAELGAVAAGLAPRRESDTEIIITMNMGVAVEDVATAKEIYELAKEKSIGVTLPL
jgi:ornithine cyclodeaminase/alanine dehydrogenase-like protein (mu-crystallin family)